MLLGTTAMSDPGTAMVGASKGTCTVTASKFAQAVFVELVHAGVRLIHFEDRHRFVGRSIPENRRERKTERVGNRAGLHEQRKHLAGSHGNGKWIRKTGADECGCRCGVCAMQNETPNSTSEPRVRLRIKTLLIGRNGRGGLILSNAPG